MADVQLAIAERSTAMDFFDAVSTTRAMRRLHPDPVPEADLWTILETATLAASGGNVQPWGFVVIRDAGAKEKIAGWYLDAWQKTYGPGRDQMLANPRSAKMFNSADHLANHLAEAPVLILVTTRKDSFRSGPIAGASVYPAVQNLMLAARALGYGTTADDAAQAARHRGEGAAGGARRSRDDGPDPAGQAEGDVRTAAAPAGRACRALGTLGRDARPHVAVSATTYIRRRHSPARQLLC
jgi:hypothetical protein